MAINPALAKMLAAANNKYKSSGGKAHKLSEGRTQFRILIDPKRIAEPFWQDSAVHWIKADKNGKPLAVIGDCETVFQKPSVVNAAIEMAINNAMDDESKELYESWKSRKSVLLPVIIRPSTDEVTILELTPTTFGKVTDLITMYATTLQDANDPNSGIDITDPQTGLDIVITRTGKGLNTNYDVAVAPGNSKPVPPEVFDKMPNLLEHVEREFFRGEEQKALNAIQQISGVAVPRLGAPAAGATALASPATSVEGAAAAPAAAPAAAAPAAAPAADAQDDIARQIAELQAKQAAAAAAAPAAAPAAEPVAAAPAADPAAALSDEDTAAILAELDGL